MVYAQICESKSRLLFLDADTELCEYTWLILDKITLDINQWKICDSKHHHVLEWECSFCDING